MWNNKLKAVTFSFDDGVIQDKRMIELLDKYNIKATFNLNSNLFELVNVMKNHNDFVQIRIKENEVKDLYKNHEVAVHTMNHPHLENLSDKDIIKEVSIDQKRLSELVDYDVMGMAYPFGVSESKNEVEVIRNNTNILYARSARCSRNFELPTDLINFNPSYKFNREETLLAAKRFVELETDSPILLYIWGHTYELDMDPSFSWEMFEEELKILANHDDIFYGTNIEVFKDLKKE